MSLITFLNTGSGGGTVGTDDQQLELDGTVLELEDGGPPIDLAPLLASGGVDHFDVFGNPI